MEFITFKPAEIQNSRFVRSEVDFRDFKDLRINEELLFCEEESEQEVEVPIGQYYAQDDSMCCGGEDQDYKDIGLDSTLNFSIKDGGAKRGR